jgi:DNA-directed RNA polymerase specialized sigma24 family protein
MQRSDDELLRRTPAEPAAFGEFYARHESAVLGFMRRRTGDPELAADLTAETFAAALVSVRRYHPGPAPAARRRRPSPLRARSARLAADTRGARRRRRVRGRRGDRRAHACPR